MKEFELNSIRHDRFGDYKIVENDGTSIIAEYVSGSKLGEWKIFDRSSKDLILRIHANIERERRFEKEDGYGKASRDSVEDLLEIFKRAPKEKIIVGNDIDSIFCVILMEKAFGSKVVGMYDGSTLRINKDCDLKECLFLDIEILNKNYYSIGNHLNCIHPECFKEPSFMERTKNCINANIVNRISGKQMEDKYPFGTNLLLLLMLEKLGIPPSKLGIERRLLLSSIALSDGSANSMFNIRYHNNTRHWTGEFFGGSELAENYTKPIYKFDAAAKIKAESAFNIGSKIKTSINKKSMKELTELSEFLEYVRGVYHCMDLEFDVTSWPVFENFDLPMWEVSEGKDCDFHEFKKDVTDDITKMRNMHLYSKNSKMITSCIRSGENMDYSEDVNNVFEE